MEEVGKRHKLEFIKENKTGKVLIEEVTKEFALGYTENYIKCYLKGDFQVGDIVEVDLIEPFKDGALARKKV